MIPYELVGAAQLYRATDRNRYREKVLLALETQAGEIPESDFIIYFFAWCETGEGRYCRELDRLWEKIEREGKTMNSMPFYAAYDTVFKKKEHYDEIVGMFRNKRNVTGSELVVMIDTLDWMSKEIYEYYRELRDLFKAAIQEKIRTLPEAEDRVFISYAILKACAMEILQDEKYAEYGLLIWEKEVKKKCRRGGSLGIERMVQAQVLLLEMRGGLDGTETDLQDSKVGVL